MSKPSTSVESRFWKFVKKDGDRCWLWLGARSRRGYGEMYIRRGKCGISSRISWEIANGPIPDGLCVLHKCDNPPCVNPSYLFLGTHKDNIQDMIAKGCPLHVVKLAERNRGEGNYNAKLSNKDVVEIKKLLAIGIKKVDIGKRYGVTLEAIVGIAKGKTWKHVEISPEASLDGGLACGCANETLRCLEDSLDADQWTLFDAACLERIATKIKDHYSLGTLLMFPEDH